MSFVDCFSDGRVTVSVAGGDEVLTVLRVFLVEFLLVPVERAPVGILRLAGIVGYDVTLRSELKITSLARKVDVRDTQ